MHRFTQQAVILFTLLTLPPAVWAGSTTYDIQNYPGILEGYILGPPTQVIQNGWTLSGTITTDGFIGDINENDIKSWTWTVTSGATTYTAKSTDPGASTIVEGPTIQATQTEILIPDSPWPVNTYGHPEAVTLVLSSGAEALSWTMEYAFPWSNWPSSLIYTNAGRWHTYEWQTGPTPYLYWTVAQASAAAVPEPASLYLVGFGAVCGCVYVMGHKRRARRTATTAA